MKPILEIQNISKKFRISHQTAGYLSLRERMTNVLKFEKNNTEDFWALKDVSFDVQPGDSIGIIGRNGAGKSTLLKILSKITPPTSGKIISRGRIASLLEVGTGFHPELTGRENIFFNGSLLGMKRKEIESKFDEIVDFSGVEKFLDTPLKHYSSGMQLRLAFAVAAFLEPEILIIDEVLAVGDAEFQKKCLGKMEDVSKSGRTILFVSHNMTAVDLLCNKSVLLSGGRIIKEGSTKDVIAQYLNEGDSKENQTDGEIIFCDTDLPIKKIEVIADGRKSMTTKMGGSLSLQVHFESKAPLEEPVLGLIFKDSQRSPLLGINNRHYIGNFNLQPMMNGIISVEIPKLTLFEGIYFIDVHFGNLFRDIQVIQDCFSINVEALNFSNKGQLPERKLNRFFIDPVLWSLKEN
ncbi:MAG: Teichoic acid export ATP-binding protein TagH [Cytophagales bacterium]|jgi:lipopolysaccharide transport system ATP-binding protein|nr:MAG: Teichoic acid export ATP-binding protein TagH [Cytophagales bacterium]